MATKSRMMIGAAILMVLVIAVAAYAAQQRQAPQPGMMSGTGCATAVQPAQMAMQPRQMGGMMGMQPGQMRTMGMCAGHMGMMGGMMSRSAIAVQGSDVYVLAGDKILKYDRDLKLLREAEVKTDMGKMNQLMQQMINQCPMRQQMTKMTQAPGPRQEQEESRSAMK